MEARKAFKLSMLIGLARRGAASRQDSSIVKRRCSPSLRAALVWKYPHHHVLDSRPRYFLNVRLTVRYEIEGRDL